MKKILILILIFSFNHLFANKITKYEYWFNDNYAGKVTVNITPTENYNLQTEISLPALDAGVNSFKIRFYDEEEEWSAVKTYHFLRENANTDNLINSAFYRFNDGEWSEIAVDDAQTLHLQHSPSISSLSDGVNKFDIYFKDSYNNLSTPLSHKFFVDKSIADNKISHAFYRFDSDNFTEVDVDDQNHFNYIDEESISALSSGLHRLEVYFKDIFGQFSPVLSYNFLKSQVDESNKVAYYEYWFNEDYDNKIEVTLETPTTLLDIESDITVPVAYRADTVRIFMRYQDTKGLWSNVLYKEVLMIKNHLIPLSTGWNMISTYITPQQKNMDSVFQEIVANILITKNGEGKLYVPTYHINTIVDWNIHHGYQVYATVKDTLKISGIPAVPETDSIFTTTGWNMLGYLRNSPIPSPTAMVSLTEFNKLLIAKNGKGKLFVPAYNINTIENFVPGDGYQIYITGPDTLIYPPNIIEEFETVVIGEQEWMVRNLDVTHYRNGDVIFHAVSDEDWTYARDNEIGAWCYYDNDEDNGEIYGKLYNWYAVNDSRGLAPDGFHVPSDAEWTELTDCLSNNSQYWCNNNSSFIAKSIASKEYWKTHSYICVVGTNREENNTSGFTGFPGGYRSIYEETFFTNIENTAYWWSSTNYDEAKAWCTYIYYYDTGVGRFRNHKGYGFSVRCVRD